MFSSIIPPAAPSSAGDARTEVWEGEWLFHSFCSSQENWKQKQLDWIKEAWKNLENLKYLISTIVIVFILDSQQNIIIFENILCWKAISTKWRDTERKDHTACQTGILRRYEDQNIGRIRLQIFL